MNFLNLKTAIGNFRKNKLLSLLNIAGLGTGLAVAILIFNYSYQEFQADKYHENLKDIYVVLNKDASHVPYEMASLIDGQFSGIKYVTLVESAMQNHFVLKYGNDESIKSEIIFTDNNFR